MTRRKQSKALARIDALTLRRALDGKLNSTKRLHDGGGLYLRVAPGSCSWILRYQTQKRIRTMGLGSLSSVPAPEARELARRYREAKAQGGDPMIDRRREQRLAAAAAVAERAKATTFKSFADPILDSFEQADLNRKHSRQWKQCIVAYVYPVLGNMTLDEIEPSHILQVLQPIWGEKAATARRVRQRLEYLFDEARLLKLTDRPNPARMADLRRSLARYAVARERRHHPALAWRKVPALMKRLRRDNDLSSLALQLVILSACRTGEVLGACFPEFENGTWMIPASRMKGENGRRRAHRVPITTGIAAIVKGLGQVKRSDLLFPGRRSSEPLSNMSMLMKLRRLDVAATVHGFRSSFRDWCAETGQPREIAEAALAHVVPGVEGSYFRSDLFELRITVMESWNALLSNRQAAGKKIIGKLIHKAKV